MSQSKVRRRRVCESCREVTILTAAEFKVHVSACLDGARKVATPEQVATDRVDGASPETTPELSQSVPVSNHGEARAMAPCPQTA